MPPAIRNDCARLFSLAVAILILGSSLHAQADVTLGPVQTVGLQGPFDRGIPIGGLQHDTTRVLLWNHSTHAMTIGTSVAGDFLWRFRSLVASFPFDDVLLSDIDGDGQTDLIFPDRSSRSIRIVSNWLDVDSLTIRQRIAVNRMPNMVVAGDINRDGTVDLLVLDENEPGILPVVNKGSGNWQMGPLIARDLPIRSMRLTYLNNDVMVDLIVVDWVRNELHTLYGVGRGRFLDQGVFPLSIAVDKLVIHQPEGDRPLRAILHQRMPSIVQTWEMDEQGDLHMVDDRTGEKQITEISILEGPGETTRVAAFIAPDRMRIWTYFHQPRLSEVLDYGLPTGVVGLIGLPGGGVLGLMPEAQSMFVFRTGSDVQALGDSVEYVVGVRPTSIDAAQANGDSLVDLVVTNRGSRSISFLPGLGSGAFGGQIPFEMPERPVGVFAGVPGDTSIRVYATHPETQIVSASEVDVIHQSIITSEIPTPGSPDLLSEIMMGNGKVMFTALHTVQGSGAILSLYERLKEETFLERTFQLSAPAILVGATITRFNNDDIPDIVFVYKPDDSTDVTVGVAFGDSAFTMRQRHIIQELHGVHAERAFVWSEDLNGDGLRDLLVVFPKNAQQIYTLWAETDTTFGDPVLVDSLARFDAFSQMRIVDVNSDGLPDLVALLQQRGGIGWWTNVGGSYSSWKYLTGSSDVAGFVVRDLNGDGIPDIAMTQPLRGSIAIHNGKRFGWGMRRE